MAGESEAHSVTYSPRFVCVAEVPAKELRQTASSNSFTSTLPATRGATAHGQDFHAGRKPRLPAFPAFQCRNWASVLTFALGTPHTRFLGRCRNLAASAALGPCGLDDCAPVRSSRAGRPAAEKNASLLIRKRRNRSRVLANRPDLVRSGTRDHTNYARLGCEIPNQKVKRARGISSPGRGALRLYDHTHDKPT